ncbi:hypothetical protein C6502_19530 [Candidatus Poribacteria bacterium]|nr:MAG: hypothetical protein C6502_19530 [Candidatus Poribacteria bacterium]
MTPKGAYHDTKRNPYREGEEVMLVPNLAPASFDYAHTSAPNRDTTKAIARIPDEAETHNTRGITYSENGDQDRAIAEFSRAIALKPDFAAAYNNRGIAYGEKGEYDLAIEGYNKTIQLKPNSADAYNNRGAAYINKGEIDRAIKDCSKAIELNPNYAKAYYNRGVSYGLKGDYDRAIEDFNTAIGLNPDFAKVYYTRGVIYGEKGDFDCAIADYNMAIGLNPDNANAYYNRGAAYIIQGDFDRAIKDCSKVIELNPNDISAYSNRGVAYGQKGDYDHAIEDLTKVIELNPSGVSAYNNRGLTYSEKGDYNRAIADYTKTIELNPDDARAYYNRGKAWLHLKEWDKARADLIAAKGMEVDIIASFHRDYESVSDFEDRKDIKLPENISAMLTPQVVVKTGLDEFLGNYARAWEGSEKALQLKGNSIHTDLDGPTPKDIEKILQKVRAEAEEERRLDQELDAIPETAYEDVDRFLKTVNKFVPLPDIMPLDNGEICLEWREGQKIFTLSFGGDGHIVFAGIFGAGNQARGILTFSMPHLIAVIGMITGLYLHYDN